VVNLRCTIKGLSASPVQSVGLEDERCAPTSCFCSPSAAWPFALGQLLLQDAEGHLLLLQWTHRAELPCCAATETCSLCRPERAAIARSLSKSCLQLALVGADPPIHCHHRTSQPTEPKHTTLFRGKKACKEPTKQLLTHLPYVTQYKAVKGRKPRMRGF
jgi:hypothetical protein